MPPNRLSPQSNAFDIHMLDSHRLETSDGLEAALRLIEEACNRGDHEIGGVVATLNSRPYALEYIISVLGRGVYRKFSKWTVTYFPTSRTPTVMENMSLRLVRRFSSSLLSAERSLTTNTLGNLREFHRKVELSFNVLTALEENTNVTSTGRKRGKTVTRNRPIDPLPFISLGITVPITDAEVRNVYAIVFSRLRSTLERYLLVLREPSMAEVFKSLHVEANLSSEGAGQSRNQQFPATRPTISFDSVEGFGEWPVLMSTRAHKDLRDVKSTSDSMFQAAMENLRGLSRGLFSSSNQKSLTDPKTKLPIYEAKVAEDTRIIYQVDCVPDPRYSCTTGPQYECQVIRVYGVFTYTQFHERQFWDSLSQQLQQRGSDYIERCTFRDQCTSDGVTLPAFFPPSPLRVRDIPQATPLVKVCEEDMKDIHSMLVLEKFFMLSQALLNSILTDQEFSHAFSVSAQQQEVIDYPASCYVIGRSGTGKTTTMLFKMLAIHRNWEDNSDSVPKPRQVFVTQSPVLAMKAKEYFEWLISDRSLEELHTGEEDVEQEVEFIDQDDNEQQKSELPRRFSELVDKDFPLFVTYDQLCKLLQNDTRQGNHNDGFFIPTTRELGDEAMAPTSPTSPWRSRLRAGSAIASSSDYMQQFRRNFVSYGVFWACYWDHLPQTLTRALDPALVFGEFMGVIKGSEDTIGTKQRCLDRESYNSLSVRSQGTFSHKRDDIYDLFMAYTKLKRQRQEYDAADRTHYILKELREVGLAGQKVNYLYVDEVQDNLLIDTLVLRTICSNQHGLFWGGDTAQAISVGSSFQFADLKAYQHRIEKQLSHELGVTPVEPRTFELVLNHRSHGGIVNCARSIIELVLRYWPHSIDILQPERAITEGFRPIFFTDQEDDDLKKAFPRSDSGATTNFGAHQCILVRNDATKERLERSFQGSIIMTLYESKGLEFDDVILYNFFEDSMATLNQWRLVLNEVPDSIGDLPDAPTFDETRHASICAELKFLYVAVTRARNNLWIVDSSEAAEPVKVYWSRRGQIEIRLSVHDIQNLAVKDDSSKEWSRTGRKMFFSKRYAQAAVAFQRAGRKREATICDAYHRREKARSISTAASVDRTRAFIAVADAFIACAQGSPSKRVNERLAYYRNAGECYLEARDFKNAGHHYEAAEKYPAAACAYQEGGYFHEMKVVVTRHRKDLDSTFLARSTIPARIYYFERLNIKAALTFFESEEEALVFLKNCSLDEARAKLLVQLGRILEAAEVYAKNWDMLKAVELLTTSDTHDVDFARRRIEYLLAGLQRDLTIGLLPTSSPTASKLLSFTGRLDKGAMTKQEVNELAMFEAIQRANRASLSTLARTFIEVGNHPAALLCLDHIFSSPPKLRSLPLPQVQASLSLFHDYIRLLNKLRRHESLAEGSNCQRLFGFQVQGKNHYLVPERSILHMKLARRSGPSKKGTGGHGCGYDELSLAINQFISTRIHDRTEMQNSACYNLHGFSPCLRFLVQQKSHPQKNKCASQHILQEQLTVDWYHNRIRLILLQIEILDSAHYCEQHAKDYWLGVLHSALHPPFPRFGSLANLDFSKISEGANGLRIAREWIQDVCNETDCDPSEPVDRQSFMIACTLAFDLDGENAQDFVPLTRMYTLTRKPEKKYISLDTRHVPRASADEGVNSVMQDFIVFLSAEPHRLLESGLSYLREVLHSLLRVDLNVLCDVIERVTGLFIMSHKVNSHGGTLHDVTLPRNWILNLTLLDTGVDLGMDVSTFSAFASHMIELMQRIDAQFQRYVERAPLPKEQFVADNDALLTDFTAPLYLARICFCLCLMGYNTDDADLKKSVLIGIQSLRKTGEQITPWVYRRYANADSWDDLVDAFTESLKNSPLDEIVHLVHTAITGPEGRRPEYVRLVSYTRMDEVAQLIRSVVPNALTPVPTPAHRKPPPVKVKSGGQPDGDYDRRRQQRNTGVPQEMSVGRSRVDVSGEGHGREIDEVRTNAANVIRDTYRASRHHLEQKRAGASR